MQKFEPEWNNMSSERKYKCRYLCFHQNFNEYFRCDDNNDDDCAAVLLLSRLFLFAFSCSISCFRCLRSFNYFIGGTHNESYTYYVWQMPSPKWHTIKWRYLCDAVVGCRYACRYCIGGQRCAPQTYFYAVTVSHTTREKTRNQDKERKRKKNGLIELARNERMDSVSVCVWDGVTCTQRIGENKLVSHILVSRSWYVCRNVGIPTKWWQKKNYHFINYNFILWIMSSRVVSKVHFYIITKAARTHATGTCMLHSSACDEPLNPIFYAKPRFGSNVKMETMWNVNGMWHGRARVVLGAYETQTILQLFFHRRLTWVLAG